MLTGDGEGPSRGGQTLRLVAGNGNRNEIDRRHSCRHIGVLSIVLAIMEFVIAVDFGPAVVFTVTGTVLGTLGRFIRRSHVPGEAKKPGSPAW